MDFAAERSRSPWPHRLAVVTAAATVLLIFVGGLVTNTGSALAVPDWPTTFGYNMFLYPWSKMVGGIFYEHSHRLLGSTVGVLTVALAAWLWAREPRTWVRRLGVVAVLAVVLQGVLGGLRVVLLENGLALIHACVAQAFLGLVVVLAVVTSPQWPQASPPAVRSPAAHLGLLAPATAALVYLQLVIGAVLTHTGGWLSVHVVGAGVVTVAVAVLAARVLVLEVAPARWRRPAVLLLALLVLQLGLGLGAFLWRFAGLSVSVPGPIGLAILAMHRLTGTVLWATAVVLALRIAGSIGAVVEARSQSAGTQTVGYPVRAGMGPHETKHGASEVLA